MIYNKALNSSEVLQLYQGNYNNNTGLVGSWHFDEGSGTSITDNSGKGNNGIMINMDPAIAWVRPIGQPINVLPLEGAKNYTYRLKAFGSDTESAFSNQISFTSPSCLPAEQPNFTVTSKCDGLNPFLLLKWEADSYTEYWSIYKRREGASIFTHLLNVSSPTISYRDDNVESDVTYEYYLEAVGNGVSTFSSLVAKKVEFCSNSPSKPVISSVLPACYGYSSRIKISWEATDNTISYNIWRKNITLEETDFSEKKSGLPATNTHYVDIVDEANVYSYKVEAVGERETNNFSDPSPEVTALECSNLQPSPPDLKINFFVSTGDTVAVSLSWIDAGSEEYYKLFRSGSWIEIYSKDTGEEEPPESGYYNYVDYAIIDDNNYQYKVLAYNQNALDGISSNEVIVDIPIATPGAFSLSGSYDSISKKVSLSWTEARTTEAGGNVTYNVYRDDSKLFPSPTLICEGISSSDPLELKCDDANPSLQEVFYKAVATNNGGTTDSFPIERIISFLPKWKEIVPF
jgi:fibronectin type 3 domain-containing protein